MATPTKVIVLWSLLPSRLQKKGKISSPASLHAFIKSRFINFKFLYVYALLHISRLLTHLYRISQWALYALRFSYRSLSLRCWFGRGSCTTLVRSEVPLLLVASPFPPALSGSGSHYAFVCVLAYALTTTSNISLIDR